MTAQEFQDKIKFRVEQTPYGHKSLVGRLAIQGSVSISPSDTNRSDVIDMAKKQVAELIMRVLYDDQRRELYEAVDDLIRANPLDFVALTEARDRVYTAARRQPKT